MACPLIHEAARSLQRFFFWRQEGGTKWAKVTRKTGPASSSNPTRAHSNAHGSTAVRQSQICANGGKRREERGRGGQLPPASDKTPAESGTWGACFNEPDENPLKVAYLMLVHNWALVSRQAQGPKVLSRSFWSR